MKESIYTIPINEMFEPRDGCPLCRMRDLLEERAVDYILGAAMMEPDVREETNKLGFCIAHYRMMLARKSRLQMALTMQTRLKTLLDQMEKPAIPSKKEAAAGDTCYVCEKIEWAMERMCSNLFKLYATQEEFRQLFAEQTHLCYPHYKRLMAQAGELPKKLQKPFIEQATELCRREMESLYADVTQFCNMFDYRAGNATADWGTSRTSIERSVTHLTGRPPQEGQK